MKIGFTSAFHRTFKKKITGRKEIEAEFRERVNIFKKNPFDPRLKTHKLTGSLKGWWSFSVEYNLRVVFSLRNKNQEALFMNIGSHDEVY